LVNFVEDSLKSHVMPFLSGLSGRELQMNCLVQRT
jgi:hypothetical protein